MSRIQALVLSIVAGVVLLLCLMATEAGSRTLYSCAVCRLYRNDTILFGILRRTEIENECSSWYCEHVEPNHDHVWKLRW